MLVPRQLLQPRRYMFMSFMSRRGVVVLHDLRVSEESDGARDCRRT